MVSNSELIDDHTVLQFVARDVFCKVLTERRSNSGRSGGFASRSNENIGGPPATPLGPFEKVAR